MSYLSFSQFCDVKKEFPCLRSNVSDPLNVEKNRPCIPYSKIGDEIEDCYSAYDEKNTFEFHEQMWGFALQCGNSSTVYMYACQENVDECAQIFCPYRHYQSLRILSVLMIVAVYQVDVAIINMIVHMVKMNTGVHQMISMNNSTIAMENKSERIIIQFLTDKHFHHFNLQQEHFRYYY
jgi:hypothetical protein